MPQALQAFSYADPVKTALDIEALADRLKESEQPWAVRLNLLQRGFILCRLIQDDLWPTEKDTDDPQALTALFMDFLDETKNRCDASLQPLCDAFRAFMLSENLLRVEQKERFYDQQEDPKSTLKDVYQFVQALVLMGLSVLGCHDHELRRTPCPEEDGEKLIGVELTAAIQRDVHLLTEEEESVIQLFQEQEIGLNLDRDDLTHIEYHLQLLMSNHVCLSRVTSLLLKQYQEESQFGYDFADENELEAYLIRSELAAERLRLEIKTRLEQVESRIHLSDMILQWDKPALSASLQTLEIFIYILKKQTDTARLIDWLSDESTILKLSGVVETEIHYEEVVRVILNADIMSASLMRCLIPLHHRMFRSKEKLQFFVFALKDKADAWLDSVVDDLPMLLEKFRFHAFLQLFDPVIQQKILTTLISHHEMKDIILGNYSFSRWNFIVDPAVFREFVTKFKALDLPLLPEQLTPFPDWAQEEILYARAANLELTSIDDLMDWVASLEKNNHIVLLKILFSSKLAHSILEVNEQFNRLLTALMPDTQLWLVGLKSLRLNHLIIGMVELESTLPLLDDEAQTMLINRLIYQEGFLDRSLPWLNLNNHSLEQKKKMLVSWLSILKQRLIIRECIVFYMRENLFSNEQAKQYRLVDEALNWLKLRIFFCHHTTQKPSERVQTILSAHPLVAKLAAMVEESNDEYLRLSRDVNVSVCFGYANN